MARRLSLLGGFELRCAGQDVAVARSGQRLLALLALQARPLERCWVAGTLWLDATEERAGASLRSALWRLPQPGGAAVVEASTTHLRLARDLAVDVHELADRAKGLASSTTGSLAGQLVLDGLLGWRVPAVARRAVTMVPAVVVLAAGVNEVAALVWSQIALSLALPAVAIPLVALTSRPQVMGELANRAPLRRLATAAVAVLVLLNVVLLASLLA